MKKYRFLLACKYGGRLGTDFRLSVFAAAYSIAGKPSSFLDCHKGNSSSGYPLNAPILCLVITKRIPNREDAWLANELYTRSWTGLQSATEDFHASVLREQQRSTEWRS
jgi:hypothetical protein